MSAFQTIGRPGGGVSLEILGSFDMAIGLKSKVVSAQEPAPRGLFFSPDGLKMYVTGSTIFQYTLSTAWDVSTATYSGLSKSVSVQEPVPYGLFFSPDGLKMFVVGSSSDTVFQYTLSTAWNVSTATYNNLNKIVTTQDAVPKGLFFSPDGLKMFVLGASNDTIFQYTLSTAWKVSTATYSTENKSVFAQTDNPTSLFFSPDGLKMFVAGSTSIAAVHQYTLTTAWDVSTATYSTRSRGVSFQLTTPSGLFFSPDGLKMFVVGQSGGSVFQYDLRRLS